MKNNYKILSSILSLLILFSIASCKKNDEGGKGLPTVTRVRYLSKTDTIPDVTHRVNLDSNSIYDDTRVVPFDSTTTQGRLGTQYAIIGTNLLTTKSVSFNGVAVYFNPALVTDNSVIVTLPSNTSTVQIPFGPSQINNLAIVTNYGQVEFSFGIQQPAAVITNFSPLAASPGDVITITGSIFNSLTSVMFGTTAAEIVGTPTNTEIKVKVPAGIVSDYIYVTTPGGVTKSTASYGFKYIIFDDVLQGNWGGSAAQTGNNGYDGYGSVRNYKDTAQPKRGNFAIATIMDNAYGALQIGYGGPTDISVQTLGLTALKISVYGGNNIKDGDKLQVVLNGNYGKSFIIDLKPGVYTDYTIPLSSLGSPAVITEIVLQGQGEAAPSTFYVDDMGFI